MKCRLKLLCFLICFFITYTVLAQTSTSLTCHVHSDKHNELITIEVKEIFPNKGIFLKEELLSDSTLSKSFNFYLVNEALFRVIVNKSTAIPVLIAPGNNIDIFFQKNEGKIIAKEVLNSSLTNQFIDWDRKYIFAIKEVNKNFKDLNNGVVSKEKYEELINDIFMRISSPLIDCENDIIASNAFISLLYLEPDSYKCLKRIKYQVLLSSLNEKFADSISLKMANQSFKKFFTITTYSPLTIPNN